MSTRGSRAVLWSAMDMGSRQALQLAFMVTLARLITPREFGIVALLSLFLAVAIVIADGGMGLALVQRRDTSQVDESTAFWANLAIGAVLSAAIAGSGPIIANFYDTPVLKPLAAVMGLNVVLSSLGSVHQALLTKALNFKPLLLAGTISVFVSGSVAVALAALGLGVWALAVQSVAMSAANAFLLWRFSRWRPSLTISAASFRRLLSFGGYMLAANLSDTAYTRANTVLVGRLFGPVDVGYYTRADATQQIPATLLGSVVGRVILPLFSDSASDLERLRRGTRVAIRSMMVVNVPLMLGLGALARPVVMIVFGSQWAPAVPILQVLALGAALWPVHVVNLHVLMAQGHSRLVWKLEIVKKSIGLALLTIGATQGVMGLAWATVVSGVIAFAVNVFYTNRQLRYGALAQLADILPIVATTVPIALLTYVLSRTWNANSVAMLLVLGMAYAGLSVLAFIATRSKAFRDLIMALVQRRAVVEELS